MLSIAMRKTVSPFQTDRERSTIVRQAEGTCCICGKRGLYKGADVYSVLAYYIKRRSTTVPMCWDRYLGVFEALFCGGCLPQTLIEERKSKLLKRAKITGYLAIFCLLAAALFIYLKVVPLLMLAVVALLISILIFYPSYRRVTHALELEFEIFCSKITEFVQENIAELRSLCEIGNLSWYNTYVHTPLQATRDLVAFVIEPGRTKNSYADGQLAPEDFGKTRWMQGSALDRGDFAVVVGKTTRYWND